MPTDPGQTGHVSWDFRLTRRSSWPALGARMGLAEVRDAFPDEQPMTVGELIEVDALGVQPRQTAFFNDADTGALDGPYTWTVWVGDEARSSYDDEAEVSLDAALRARPGVERVLWEDREILHVGAPTLCAYGMLAAAARALLDPRVRLGEHS